MLPVLPPPTKLGYAPARDPLDGVPAPTRGVLLFCPPFQHARLSSLSTALLATLLRERGARCAEAYVHFELVRLIGPEAYDKVTDGDEGLTGELLFAEALHGPVTEPGAGERLTALFGDGERRQEILARLETRCLEQLRRHEPEVIGLTTSLNQLLAALWIARLVKREYPRPVVVLGGSACAEPMGKRLAEAYPFVDYVVSGYGERPLLALAAGELPPERFLRSHRSVDLDRLPIPDYSAFLEQAGEFREGKLNLTFESSRGCWWGEKNHCRFCGLNNLEMAFNEKSTDRVVTEVRTLWDRHGRNLFATDTILSRRHLREAMPRLAEHDTKPILFYEVKANMSEAEIVALQRANVVALQPGIESLSSALLLLLKKGVTAIRNLALLKWCRERNLAVAWNQLCAIPGEHLEDYEVQIALMEQIPQLQPPGHAHPVRIDRFSPYFENHRDYGYTAIEPFPAYRLLHPHLDRTTLDDVAYHFRGVGGVQANAYLGRFAAAISRWNERHQRGEGLFLDPQLGLVRNVPQRGTRYRPSEVLTRILAATHTITPIRKVLTHARCDRATLDELVRHGILYVEREQVLNLAVRTSPPDPSERPASTAALGDG